MDNVKVYEYKNVYRTKDGTIKEYIIKHTKEVKERKIKDKDLIELIKEIKDQEKRKQIREYLNNIKDN